MTAGTFYIPLWNVVCEIASLGQKSFIKRSNQINARKKFSLFQKFQLLLFLLNSSLHASPCTYSVGQRKVEKASDTENTIVSEKNIITDQE